MWRHRVETSLIPRLTTLTLMILMTWHSGCSTRTDSAWLHATAPLRVHRWMCANHGGETSERTPWVTGNRDLDWWERDYRRDALVVITCHSYISDLLDLLLATIVVSEGPGEISILFPSQISRSIHNLVTSFQILSKFHTIYNCQAPTTEKECKSPKVTWTRENCWHLMFIISMVSI